MEEKKSEEEEVSEDELDQIIQDMSTVENEDAQVPAKPTLELVHGKKNANSQALTLEMTGVVNLRLTFKNGDRSIELLCSDEALVCKMADGTEFRIPTGVGKARKTA